jgi:transcriptional regulator with XRE-family HTH domain
MGRPIRSLKRKTDTPDEALGAVLTELRVKRGLSYQDVAAKVGCHIGHMNEIENGKQNVTIRLLRAIADFHQIPLWKILKMADAKYARGNKKTRPKRTG